MIMLMTLTAWSVPMARHDKQRVIVVLPIAANACYRLWVGKISVFETLFLAASAKRRKFIRGRIQQISGDCIFLLAKTFINLVQDLKPALLMVLYGGPYVPKNVITTLGECLDVGLSRKMMGNQLL